MTERFMPCTLTVSPEVKKLPVPNWAGGEEEEQMGNTRLLEEG